MTHGILKGFGVAVGLALTSLPATAHAQKMDREAEQALAMGLATSDNATDRDVGREMLRKLSRTYDKAERANVQKFLKAADAEPVDLNCQASGTVDAEGYQQVVCKKRTQTTAAPVPALANR